MIPAFDPKNISPDTRMADLLRSNLNLLFVLNQFSLPMGFGDKTIREVCEKNQVDTDSFLIMLQFHGNPDKPDLQKLNQLNTDTILNYLKNSHTYFLNYRLPTIREQFEKALPSGSTCKTILSYFDEYEHEVREHMNYENTVFFPYVQNLLYGIEQNNYSVNVFESRHNNIEEKLDDLINLLIKYLPTEGNYFVLADVLEDIKSCHRDLNLHTLLEDEILVPKIHKLEKNVHTEETKPKPVQNELSEREKDIVRSVAKGLSNKEIADRHFISIHTVITHRRNISRKLAIHSPAGLTVYAILNNLIDIEELRH